jgi:hypothetical protein
MYSPDVAHNILIVIIHTLYPHGSVVDTAGALTPIGGRGAVERGRGRW